MQPVLGQFFTREFGEITVPDDDAPGCRTVEPRNQIQNRRLSGSGASKERDKVSVSNLERDAIDRANQGLAHAVVTAKILAADRGVTTRGITYCGCRHRDYRISPHTARRAPPAFRTPL